MHLVTTAEEKVMSEDGLQNCPVVIFHNVSICKHAAIDLSPLLYIITIEEGGSFADVLS